MSLSLRFAWFLHKLGDSDTSRFIQIHILPSWCASFSLIAFLLPVCLLAVDFSTGHTVSILTHKPDYVALTLWPSHTFHHWAPGAVLWKTALLFGQAHLNTASLTVCHTALSWPLCSLSLPNREGLEGKGGSFSSLLLAQSCCSTVSTRGVMESGRGPGIFHCGRPGIFHCVPQASLSVEVGKVFPSQYLP